MKVAGRRRTAPDDTGRHRPVPSGAVRSVNKPLLRAIIDISTYLYAYIYVLCFYVTSVAGDTDYRYIVMIGRVLFLQLAFVLSSADGMELILTYKYLDST